MPERITWFVTHPEVAIDPLVAVTDWTLTEGGRDRLRRARPRFAGCRSFWASGERKAWEAAGILAGTWPVTILAALGENDRSATGYLPRAAFEATADEFFARPFDSVRGWERAVDAQARIVAAVDHVLQAAPEGEVAIVAHGGVGALYLCHLTKVAITRAADQPAGSGGHCFAFAGGRLLQDWRPIDD